MRWTMNQSAVGRGKTPTAFLFLLLVLSGSPVSAGEPPARKPVPVSDLAKVVEDGTNSDRTRVEAARQLALSPDPEAISPILKVIGDAHEKGILRAALIHTLDQTPHKKAVIPVLEARLANKEDPYEVREATASTLGSLGELSSKPLLLRTSSDPHPEVRQAARSSLLKVGGEGVDRMRILIETLQDQDQPGTVRASAARQLGETKYPRAFLPLLEALKEKSIEAPPPQNFAEFLASRAAAKGNVQAAAARSLGNIGDPEAIPHLISLASSKSIELRVAVFEALATLKAKDAVPAARKSLSSDPEQQVRRWAALLLREIGDREALPDLRRALSDADPGVRLQAAQALGKMKDREALKEIEKILSQEKSSEVHEALENTFRILRESPDPCGTAQ
jgi:HEAT repeat protein